MPLYSKQRLVFALAVCAFAVIYWTPATRFINSFPSFYSWTDLMISYQGGFIRRGLLGEVAYHLDGIVPAKYSLIGMVGAAYLLSIGCCTWIVSHRPQFSTLLFLASPATLLFPVYDFAAFGRKDIFILAAFAGSLALARSARSDAVAFGGMILVYLVAAFVVEVSFFYLPFAICAGAAMRETKQPILMRSAASAVVCAIVFFALTATLNQHADIAAMIGSWRAIYPEAFQYPGATTFLNMSLSQGWHMVGHIYYHGLTFASYVLAMLFASIPLFMLNCRLHWMHSAVLLGLVPLGLAADWGRYISLFTIHAYVMASVLPNDEPPTVPIAAQIGLFALYATAWEMKHFVEGGNSALVPGILFD